MNTEQITSSEKKLHLLCEYKCINESFSKYNRYYWYYNTPSNSWQSRQDYRDLFLFCVIEKWEAFYFKTCLLQYCLYWFVNHLCILIVWLWSSFFVLLSLALVSHVLRRCCTEMIGKGSSPKFGRPHIFLDWTSIDVSHCVRFFSLRGCECKEHLLRLNHHGKN